MPWFANLSLAICKETEEEEEEDPMCAPQAKQACSTIHNCIPKTPTNHLLRQAFLID
jgi:hypothetical protein